MTYNSANQRVRKESGAATTKFIWDEHNSLVETNGLDVAQVVYTTEPQLYGNVISQHAMLDSHYFHFDVLGATRQLTSSAAFTTDTFLYKAWGEVVSNTGMTVPRFTWVGEHGYQSDVESLAFWVRSREFSPTIGRWISLHEMSRDALAFDRSFRSLSCWYDLASNSPINAVVPSGGVYALASDTSVREAMRGIRRVGHGKTSRIPPLLEGQKQRIKKILNGMFGVPQDKECTDTNGSDAACDQWLCGRHLHTKFAEWSDITDADVTVNDDDCDRTGLIRKFVKALVSGELAVKKGFARLKIKLQGHCLHNHCKCVNKGFRDVTRTCTQNILFNEEDMFAAAFHIAEIFPKAEPVARVARLVTLEILDEVVGILDKRNDDGNAAARLTLAQCVITVSTQFVHTVTGNIGSCCKGQ